MSFGRMGALGRGFGHVGGSPGGHTTHFLRADSTMVTADVTGVLADRTSILVDSTRLTIDMSALSADYAR